MQGSVKAVPCHYVVVVCVLGGGVFFSEGFFLWLSVCTISMALLHNALGSSLPWVSRPWKAASITGVFAFQWAIPRQAMSRSAPHPPPTSDLLKTDEQADWIVSLLLFSLTSLLWLPERSGQIAYYHHLLLAWKFNYPFQDQHGKGGNETPKTQGDLSRQNDLVHNPTNDARLSAGPQKLQPGGGGAQAWQMAAEAWLTRG